MSGSSAQPRSAGSREAGALCALCQVEIRFGERVTACRTCGEIHHLSCWDTRGGCGSWNCAPERKPDLNSGDDAIRITTNDLDAAVPLTPFPTSDNFVGPAFATTAEEARTGSRKPLNGLAVAAFIIGIIALPAFGIVTGLLAVIVGCIALVQHSNRKRGFGFGVAGILLGIVAFCGWGVGLFVYSGAASRLADVQIDLDPDLAALRDLPEPISRAMHANVVVQAGSGLLGTGIGSGIILRIDDNDSAIILTNRHVVDSEFESDNGAGDADVAGLMIKLLDQPSLPGKLEWVAPDGLDLAIVSTSVVSNLPEAARWDATPAVQIGEKVFAIGNPHGLGWTHTSGDVSQVRRQSKGGTSFRVFQTSAAINPGNSGGGLYLKDGRLVGVNTWTQDKRVAEGLGFSIDFGLVLRLAPKRFRLDEIQLQSAERGEDVTEDKEDR